MPSCMGSAPPLPSPKDKLKLLKMECPERPTLCAVFNNVFHLFIDYFDVHLLGKKLLPSLDNTLLITYIQ